MSKTPQRNLTDGQRAYEARRAAKAGMSLEKWLAAKDREAAEAARAQEKARQAEARPVVSCITRRCSSEGAKVFCFFFSKKKAFLPCI